MMDLIVDGQKKTALQPSGIKVVTPDDEKIEFHCIPKSNKNNILKISKERSEILNYSYKRRFKMLEKILNQTICLKQHISEKEYKEINQLKDICRLQDKTNLKLELDYKINMSRSSEIGLTNINEFLYYIDGILVAYLGISSFGGSNIGEVNGMTHPDFRRNGLFKKSLNWQ